MHDHPLPLPLNDVVRDARGDLRECRTSADVRLARSYWRQAAELVGTNQGFGTHTTRRAMAAIDASADTRLALLEPKAAEA
jgi:hypothetical protein